MASIYRIWIQDFGSLQQQIRKKNDLILLPGIPRIGDIIEYFYMSHPEADDTEVVILKVSSVKLLCQPGVDNLNIAMGKETQFWDDSFSYHAEITVDRTD